MSPEFLEVALLDSYYEIPVRHYINGALPWCS